MQNLVALVTATTHKDKVKSKLLVDTYQKLVGSSISEQQSNTASYLVRKKKKKLIIGPKELKKIKLMSFYKSYHGIIMYV